MNGNRALLVLRALGLPTLVACAPSPQTRPDSTATETGAARASNWTADSAAIVGALASSREAWNRGDLDAHYAPFADSAVLVFHGGANDPPMQPLAKVRAMAAAELKKQSVPQLSIEPLVVKPLGPDAVLSVSRFTMKPAGRPDISVLNTRVWSRTPAGWRIVADHTS